MSFPSGVSRLALLLCLWLFLWWTQTALAAWTLHVGPVGMGMGGPNPISIPPTQLVEYELVWLTEDHTEWSFGLVPGVILYGKRLPWENGLYASFGGGYVLSARGGGPGVYSAFGWNHCGWVCTNIEFKQALGWVPPMGLTSPYALRVGLVFFHH